MTEETEPQAAPPLFLDQLQLLPTELPTVPTTAHPEMERILSSVRERQKKSDAEKTLKADPVAESIRRMHDLINQQAVDDVIRNHEISNPDPDYVVNDMAFTRETRANEYSTYRLKNATLFDNATDEILVYRNVNTNTPTWVLVKFGGKSFTRRFNTRNEAEQVAQSLLKNSEADSTIPRSQFRSIVPSDDERYGRS